MSKNFGFFAFELHGNDRLSPRLGRPQPEVSWLMNGKLIDDEFEQNSGNIIENRLLWPSLQRTDLYSIFTCSASNTKSVAPKEKRIVLDMYREHPFHPFSFLATFLSRAAWIMTRFILAM